MNPNQLSHLQNKLLRVARQHPPSAAVPYAFEKRILSRLAMPSPENGWTWWGVSLWRGAVACMAITLLCGIWSYRAQHRPLETSGDFAQDLQSAMFASMNQPGEDGW